MGRAPGWVSPPAGVSEDGEGEGREGPRGGPAGGRAAAIAAAAPGGRR